jgi:hypothetical protein
MNLCKYKNIFGEPGTGVHSIRIFNIAIVDVILTILGGILIQTILLQWFHIYIELTIVLVSLFILGILLHRMFCVRTTVDKLLFNK